MVATINTDIERLLEEGKAAARTGDRDGARALLTQVVERDPHNEQAWMWLSGVVSEPEEQQICLENVLVINPQNSKARSGLDYISTKTGIPPNNPAAPSEQGNNEYTAPLADLSSYADTASQWSEPAPSFAAESSGVALPDWMQAAISGQNNSAPSDPSSFGSQYGADFQSDMPWQGNSTASKDDPLGNWGQSQNGNGTSDDASQMTWTPASHVEQPTPSELQSPGDVQSFSPFGEGGFGGVAGAAGMSAVGIGAANPESPASEAAPMDLGPMGPYSASQLPSPSELPRYNDTPEPPAAQPWYLQGTNSGNGGAPANDAYRQDSYPGSQQLATNTGPSSAKKAVANVTCPSCKTSVPDTSLACSECRFSFFVNCPHCHELVDAGDTRPGIVEPCAYCQVSIDKFQLGVAGTERAASYESERVERASAADKAMKKIEAKEKGTRVRSLTFGWAVDLLWLVVIISTVWALSQLPTWLRLTGQY